MRLRQVAFVAQELEPAVAELQDVLGLIECYRDPVVQQWGLDNAVFPIGGNFLEIVAPNKPGTSAGRYLERRGGDGGYMVILQCQDAAVERERITALGVRTIWTSDRPDYVASHFHPGDLGGILLTVDSVAPDQDYRDPLCPWFPGGPDWTGQIRRDVTTALTGVEIQSDDPLALATLWSRVLDLPVAPGGGGQFHIALDDGAEIRVVPAVDGRGTGVGAIDVQVADRDHVRNTARARGLELSDTQVTVCGTRVNLG